MRWADAQSRALTWRFHDHLVDPSELSTHSYSFTLCSPHQRHLASHVGEIRLFLRFPRRASLTEDILPLERQSVCGGKRWQMDIFMPDWMRRRYPQDRQYIDQIVEKDYKTISSQDSHGELQGH